MAVAGVVVAGIVVSLVVGRGHEEERAIAIASSDVQGIDGAVQLYIMQVGGDCPTVDDLLSEGVLGSAEYTVDPWGVRYRIECAGDEITVMSAGPDRTFGTDDDIWS